MPVIVSMTTIPSRLKSLGATLESLHKQTHAPDEIRLHLTPACDPRELAPAVRDSATFPLLRVLHVERDFGPVTKLYAATDSGLHGDTLIVTVDDDIFYKPTWLATIMEAARRWTDNAIGFAGWNVQHFLAGTGGYDFGTPPCFVDVIEGWAGVCYRKRFFDSIDILNSPPAFKFVDDVWISSTLNKRGIKRRLISFPLATPLDGDGPGLHTRLDFVELNRNAARVGWLSIDETGPVPK